MANVAAADPNSFVVSSEGLLTYDGTHFSSTAVITFGERCAVAYHDFLDAPVPTLFEGWAADAAITFAGDANGDGIADGVAWLLGAGTPDPNARALLPSANRNNGALETGFSMRNLAARGSAVLELQYGTTLESWTSVTIPEASGTHGGVEFLITPNSPLNQVVASIPASAATDGRLFIRLSGTEN